MKRGERKAVKAGLWMTGLCLVGFVVGRPLYWHVTEGLPSASIRHRSSISCPICDCDCSSQPLLSLMDELSNHTFTDCMKRDPDVSEDMEKNFVDMMKEEMKLQEAQGLENQQKADIMLLEAKKMASQFQKESDKCSSGMETCEEARQKSESALEAQRSLTAMWELRARQRGWRDGSE